MKIILNIALLFLTLNSFAQKIEYKEELINPKILKIVNGISKIIEIHSVGIGFPENGQEIVVFK